jgi:hypothetical protein
MQILSFPKKSLKRLFLPLLNGLNTCVENQLSFSWVLDLTEADAVRVAVLAGTRVGQARHRMGGRQVSAANRASGEPRGHLCASTI